jgi:hypothetical protein
MRLCIATPSSREALMTDDFDGPRQQLTGPLSAITGRLLGGEVRSGP